MQEGHEQRLETSRSNWLKHRKILERYAVKPADRRITPPPQFNVAEIFAELADKAATTVRLHPRFGDEPPIDQSKLGGDFLWPSDESWPVCPAHDIPFVTVLQLRTRDFPEMPFRPGCDLFQMLWCPREHFDIEAWANPQFYWRHIQEIREPRSKNPIPIEPYYEYVPFTCRLLPERVIEYPSVYDLSDDLNQRICEWEDQHLGPDGMHACEYEAELSVAYGTKIGGYARVIQSPWLPTCKCGQVTEHLLTLASMEWNGDADRRWTPYEEQKILHSFPPTWQKLDEEQREISHALWNPTGLMLGDAGHMQLFLCRHCEDWPIISSIECS